MYVLYIGIPSVPVLRTYCHFTSNCNRLGCLTSKAQGEQKQTEQNQNRIRGCSNSSKVWGLNAQQLGNI